MTGSQHLKHRHDADKDTEKEFGDFGNRRPCELIGRTGNLGRSGKRQNRKEDKERITHKTGKGQMHREHFKVHVAFPEDAHQHRTDNAGKPEEIDGAVNAERHGLIVIRYKRSLTDFLTVAIHFNGEVHRHQKRQRHEQRRQEVHRRPEEVNAAQEPEEQRGVSQGRKAPAHVSHNEDKENEGVHLETPPFIGRNQGANEQHRRARCPHEVCKKRADQKKRGVYKGLTD